MARHELFNSAPAQEFSSSIVELLSLEVAAVQVMLDAVAAILDWAMDWAAY